MGIAHGIDAAWNRPPVNVCLNHGVQFICGYVSWDNTGKNISFSEIDAYRAAGIDYVCNWEYGASEATLGYAKGVESATEAVRQAKALGIPDGRPIYFSVDEDVNPLSIYNYFNGAAGVCWDAGLQIGVYGSQAVCRYLYANGRAAYTWRSMSTAWQNDGMPFQFNMVQTQQYTMDNYDVDLNEAVTSDYGQWMYQGDDMALGDVYEQKLRDFLDGMVKTGNVNKRMMNEIINGIDPAPGPGEQVNYYGLKQLGDDIQKLKTSGIPNSLVLSDADKNDIASRVAKLLGEKLSNG